MATYVWPTFGDELLAKGIANVDVGGATAEQYSSVAARDGSLGSTGAGIKLAAALSSSTLCAGSNELSKLYVESASGGDMPPTVSWHIRTPNRRSRELGMVFDPPCGSVS